MNHKNLLIAHEQLPVSSEQMFPAAPYPRQHVHCAFGDLEQVVRAVHGLRAAGYAAADIHVMASWDYLDAVKRERRHQNGLSRALKGLASLFDEGFGNIYLRAAAQGQHILAVRVSRSEQLAEVRDLLTFHRAHLIKYVDTWVVADLTPPLALQWAMSVLSSSVALPQR